MGAAPDALLASGLLDALFQKGVKVASQERIELELSGDDLLGHFAQINNAVAEAVETAVTAGQLPVVLGGDCMLSLGINAGLQRSIPNKPTGVAWFDAHGDFNTPEISETGFLPGMPLACLTGYGLESLRTDLPLKPIDENHVIMLGVRDLDPKEKELLNSTPVSYLNPEDVQNGRTEIVAEYHFQDVDEVYLHLDVDVLDPSVVPGTDYLTPDGLTLETMIEAIAIVKTEKPLAAVALTALNPEVEQAQSVATAIQLLSEALAD